MNKAPHVHAGLRVIGYVRLMVEAAVLALQGVAKH